ncbi:hypothetical protein Scep_017987 [Stephania cephalantha]|uniref:Pentatricopeptide repeat-containing protein n=1 Tax=Stephania cephalantha TaxID=152367 RepID=A0AAP0IQG6_9MAGN
MQRNRNKKVDAFAALLKQCTNLTNLTQTHAQILRLSLHTNNSLASTLVTLYASLRSPRHAHRVFSSVPAPALSLFNRAIRAFSKTPSFPSNPIKLYSQMLRNRIRPDNFTYPFVLNSCGALSCPKHGSECGLLGLAWKVFDEMPVRDVVSYNAVLGAHAKAGVDMESARRVFDEMPERNVISWNAMLVGYVNGGELELARYVFDRMPERNVVSWTTMLVGYTKSGCLELGRVVFDTMPERNLVSWTAMITGYAQNGRPGEALGMFRRMEELGMKPDAVTMTSVISATAQLGGPEMANFIESYVDKEMIERNERVLTALVDMHAKCGNIEGACRLFREIPHPDVFSYSALIVGLASHGHGLKALEVFSRMRGEGVEPDCITFIGVLSACSHAGIVDEGLRYWEIMVKDYKIEPVKDHYACMVDMLGRSGRLDEAFEMVKSMPMGPRPEALGALLAACRTYGNVEIAENVALKLLELEPDNTGNYSLLADIYASRGRWDDAARVRVVMKEKRVNKLPGCSWVEVPPSRIRADTALQVT